jgi:tetratricopeptide (TPR) repeat protein
MIDTRRTASGIEQHGPSALGLACLLALLLAGATGAMADGGGGGGGGGDPTDSAGTTRRAEDPEYAAGVKAIKADDFPTAITKLKAVVAREPSNADAHNWLAYATRRNGDPAASIPIYQKALAIDPKHRGAHEYIGEAYLALGDLPKAKEHLAKLDALCFLPCSQYRDLKKAVQAFEASGGVKQTGR